MQRPCPVEGLVLRSVHRFGVQLVLRFRWFQHICLQRLTHHTSARFRGRAPGPVSGQLYGCPPAGDTGDRWLHFPVSFRLPAFASWVSCSRHGIPPPLRLAYHHAYAGVMDLTGFPRSTRMRYDRVGCHLYPGSGGVHTTVEESSVAACRFSTARSSSSPPARPDVGSCGNEASAMVHWYSPFRSSPHPRPFQDHRSWLNLGGATQRSIAM